MFSTKNLRLVLLAAPLVLPFAQVAGQSSERPFYRAELIFEPTLQFPRCHSSTITGLPDGSLIAAWWNGSEEGGRDVVIRAARRPAGSLEWTSPVVVADTPDTTEGNPVLFSAPNGDVWLFYRAGLRPWRKIFWLKSRDQGKTWAPPVALVDEPGWTLRSRIIRLRNGEILIPVMTAESSAFMYSSDMGSTWQKSESIKSEPRNNEPTVIQRANGSLLTFLRPYDPDPASRFLWQSESFDNGRTWSDPTRTQIRNPSSAVELLTLQNGHVVLVFNDSQEKRFPLVLALSEDEGRTWKYRRILEDGKGRFSYPTLFQSPDGQIHLTYTFRRLSIKHVEVNESWIRDATQ